MLNVEFKAELRDPAVARAALLSIGAEHAGELEQTDTYYRVPTGRLKKRDTRGKAAEYIVYHRADRALPKLSQYEVLDAHEFIARFGERPLPVRTIVKKVRSLYLLGEVRVHLDNVERLGTFLEVEAPVSPERNVARCHELIARLREKLGPSIAEPISHSYVDLLELESSNDSIESQPPA